jgi:hypothetical protein
MHIRPQLLDQIQLESIYKYIIGLSVSGYVPFFKGVL